MTTSASRARLLSRMAFAAVATAVVTGLALGATLPAGAEDGGVIKLKSGEAKQVVSERVLVGNPPAQLAGPGAPASPEDCRGADPAVEVSCDVYRLEIDLSDDPDALNFVRIELNWDTTRAPSLQAVAAGTFEYNAADLDAIIWDVSGEEPEPVTAGGAGELFIVPEIAGFEARSRVYDVAVWAGRAPVLGYTMTVSFSNETFSAPFEALDPAFADGFEQPGDFSSGSFIDATNDYDFNVAPAVAVPSLDPPPAAVGTDGDFSGFGSSVDNQLTGALATFRPNREVEFEFGDPPSALAVLFWMLIAPLVIAALIVLFLRRRSSAFAR